MSHTITYVPSARLHGLFTITITNYTSGGETFSLPEFQVAAGSMFTPILLPTSQNSLSTPLFPVLVGATLRLFQFSAGTFSEVPTTNGLNAILNVALVVSP